MKRLYLYVACMMMLFAQLVSAQNVDYAILRIMVPTPSNSADSREFFIEVNDDYVCSVRAHQYVSLKVKPGIHTVNVYSNTTSAGVPITNCTYEVAKKHGYSISYGDIRMMTGNVYFIDVTVAKSLSTQTAFDKALAQKKIIAGDTFDLTKGQVTIAAASVSKAKVTEKTGSAAPVSNSQSDNLLQLNVSTKDYFYSFLDDQRPPVATQQFFQENVALSLTNNTQPLMGTIDIQCTEWDGTMGNSYFRMGIMFIILDKYNNPIKAYKYDDFSNAVLTNRTAVNLSKSILKKFMKDYDSDVQQINTILQATLPIEQKSKTVTIVSPSSTSKNARLCHFVEMDGISMGAIPDKGSMTLTLSTGYHKIAIYPNEFHSYYRMVNPDHLYATTIQESKQKRPDYGNIYNFYIYRNYRGFIYITDKSDYYLWNPSDGSVSSISEKEYQNYYVMNMLEDGNNLRDYQSKNVASTQSATMQSINMPQPNKPLIHQSDVDKNIAQSATKSTNTYVLIFANENYEFLENVNYAANDGKIFKEYCVKTLGVPERQIFYYENATAGKMDDGIGKMEYCLNNFEGAKAIVYYCGHGIPDEKTGQAFLIPVDGKATSMRTCYSLTDIYKTLSATKAQSITYFMDACFTGANKEGSMLVAARGVARAPKKETLAGNTIVFSASSGDETAMTLNEEGHGLFTYYLLKKLQETEGNVTYGELATYINQNVKKDAFLINEKPQTPVVTTSPAVVNTWKTMKLK